MPRLGGVTAILRDWGMRAIYILVRPTQEQAKRPQVDLLSGIGTVRSPGEREPGPIRRLAFSAL